MNSTTKAVGGGGSLKGFLYGIHKGTIIGIISGYRGLKNEGRKAEYTIKTPKTRYRQFC